MAARLMRPSRIPIQNPFFLPLRAADARRTSSFEIPLLAGSPARRNSIQALDGDRDPGDRSPDRHHRSQPIDPRISLPRQSRRYRAAGRRDRLRRARHGARRHCRRHRPFGGIDVRAVRFLRAVLPQCPQLAGARGDRCDTGVRRGAWLHQRPVDRISATARLHHDADHADHLSLRLRSFAVRQFNQDRRRLPRFPVLEFHGRRRCRRHSCRCADLYRRGHLRACVSHSFAAGMACHRDRRLAPLGL